MTIKIREFQEKDLKEMIEIWNTVVDDGVAFPQLERLDSNSGRAFFSEQSFTGVAYDEESGEIAGLYILHPNNIGRCGHICN
ncbi:MAG: GNAT family N-acetyltransferase, partial [Clostridia bacterium]|nr:GNAT family N-acetyltransferase [Clostridia bacterium]